MTREPIDPLYDSIALTIEQFSAHTGEGWEYTPPRNGVIYARRHLSGPMTECDSFKTYAEVARSLI